MSLTMHLRDTKSPVSRFFQDYVVADAAPAMVDAINAKLADVTPLAVDGADPVSVGRAFDFAFRWNMKPFEVAADRSVRSALEYIAAYAGAGKMGRLDELVQIIKAGNQHPDLRPACSVLLGMYEEVYRSGHRPPLLLQKERLDLEKVAQMPDTQDVQALIAAIPENYLQHQRFIANPHFMGSEDVGGADGDWIIDGVLYDCKCSRKRRPMQLEYVWQAMGYVLLDYEDDLQLTGLGWYFARQRVVVRYSLESLLPRLFHCPDLAWLRKELWSAVTPKKGLLDQLEDFIALHPDFALRDDEVFEDWLEDRP